MSLSDKYILLNKKVGQTPLECLEDWRQTRPEMENIPLAYAGRLDPMASGSLLVLIGEECKKQTEYHHLDKEYLFEILFDVSSDSGDVLGLITEGNKTNVDEGGIEKILVSLLGKIELPYPIFSSKTVQGKPLHTWTMEGRLDEITIPTKQSEIFELELTNLRTLSREEVFTKALNKIESIPPVTDTRKALGNDFRRPDVRKAWEIYKNNGALEDEFYIATIRCVSSSGTYMRTLAEVVAQKLNTTGLAFSIHRTKIGSYDKETRKWSALFK